MALTMKINVCLYFYKYLFFRPYNKFVEHASYWTAFENIMMQLGGRPHWAKVCSLLLNMDTQNT